MPHLLRIILLICLSFGSISFATSEVISPRVRVTFEDPALKSYAQAVANEAEKALDILSPLFGEVKAPIVIRFDTSTDTFNALASALPRSVVELRPIFPNDSILGYGARSDLELLLIHEITHLLQARFNEQAEGEPPGGFLLGIIGEDLADVPPPWFIEGLATWLESEYTEGGRRDDALTRGLLEQHALSDTWPSLVDISLDSYSAYPGGQVRYLHGAGFIDFLVSRYGFEAIKQTLRKYNAGLLPKPFASAWQDATGTSLYDEWDAFRQALRDSAEARDSEPETLLTDTGWLTGKAQASPNGTHLAWVSWPPSIKVARLENNELDEERVLKRDIFPQSLAWLNETTLVFNRIVREGTSAYYDVFSLDLETGRETRLTTRARAQLISTTPDECILFVRDVASEASSLNKACSGEISQVWQAEAGDHIVSLSVSQAGRIALSLWRNGFVDLALLENGQIHFLTQDKFQDLDPSWQGETKLVFRSDREDIFQLYRLDARSLELTKLTNVAGGASSPAALNDAIVYSALGGTGQNLAVLSADSPVQATLSQEPRPEPVQYRDFEVRPYSPFPSLLPYGWAPSGVSASLRPLGLGASVSAYGHDYSANHSYAFTLGYDSLLSGHLWGGTALLEYGYKNTVDLSPVEHPIGFGVKLGVWEHSAHLVASSETALGAVGIFKARYSLDTWVSYTQLELGSVHLQSYGAWQIDGRFDTILSQRRTDSWGYVNRGPRFGVTARLSATKDGASPGVWADASYYSSLSQLGLGLPGTAEFLLRAGYRQGVQVPLSLDSYAAVGTLGYRYTLPVKWRYSDGLFALERITLTPRLRGWFDGELGVGSDISFNLDTVSLYNAPVSFGITLGYAQSFWYRVSFDLSL